MRLKHVVFLAAGLAAPLMMGGCPDHSGKAAPSGKTAADAHEPHPSVPNMITSNLPRALCEGVPTWSDSYETIDVGGKVQNKGNLYECRPKQEGAGAEAYCRQDHMEPGTDREDWWGEVWLDEGMCEAPEAKGNVINVKLPPHPGVTKQAVRDDEPTGVIRCPETGKEHVVSGTWGSTVQVDELEICDYQLIMNGTTDARPVNTPAVISLTQTEKQSVDFSVKYAPSIDVAGLTVLPGVHVEIFAQGLIEPRQMALGKGVLYVGSSSIPDYAAQEGVIGSYVYALPLDEATGRPVGIYLLDKGLIEPHGVAYRDGTLYYSTTRSLYAVENVDANYKDIRGHKKEVARFPAGDNNFPLPTTVQRWHQKHPLYFNPTDPPDKKIYTAVGRPCNVCVVPADARYGSILSFDLEKSPVLVTALATGVRNSVGFDWNPKTKQIWFSDNNRQNIPNPDELNVITSAVGQPGDYGAPYMYGRATVGYTQDEYDGKSVLKPNDPDLAAGSLIGQIEPGEISTRRYKAAALELASNSAPLGVKFIPDALYPGAAPNTQQLVMAVHGGGSGQDPGMDVRLVRVSAASVISVMPFITGWSKGALGRPVDFLVMADGSLLISDDVAGTIYRVTFDATGLPDTELTIEAGPKPPSSNVALTTTPATGFLVDEKGGRRRFSAKWDDGVFPIDHLPFGTYHVLFDDIDVDAGNGDGSVETFVSRNPDVTVELKADASKVQVSGAYGDAPDIQAVVRFSAPQKPADSTSNTFDVVVTTAGASKTISVPWGARVEQSFGYGRHEVKFPYQTRAIPVPARSEFQVRTAATIDAPSPVYTSVGDVGEALTSAGGPGQPSGACYSCHRGSFDNSETAASYKDNKDGLVQKILTMSDRMVTSQSHCDIACAQQVADYFYDVLWKPFFDPGEPYGTRQLRLLTRDEYIASVNDILGVKVEPDSLPAIAATKYYVYPGKASEGVVDGPTLLKFYKVSVSVANKVDLRKVGYRAGDDISAFVETLGHRLFRRRLTGPEVKKYLEVAGTEGEELDGPHLVVAAMLASPNFLYRSELGEAVPGNPGVYKLTANEMATSLSFGYLGKPPSDELLARAESGGLDTETQVQAEIERMIATEDGKNHFYRFIQYYTRTNVGPSLKEGLPPDLINAMGEEQRQFVYDIIGRKDGTVSELFDADFTYLNKPLAEHYGIAGSFTEAMKRVTLPPGSHRGGLLTQGEFLASPAASDINTTSMIRRGFIVRENLFCRRFGSAENDSRAPVYPEKPVNNRERWELINGHLSTSKSCYSCHQYVNDLGASMEHFDQTGKYRAQENAVNYGYQDKLVDIDSSGPLISNTGGTWLEKFDDVSDIARFIPDNASAMNCLASSYYRYLFGDVPDSALRTVFAVQEQLLADHKLHTMLTTLGASEAMRLRKDPVADSPRSRVREVGPEESSPHQRRSANPE